MINSGLFRTLEKRLNSILVLNVVSRDRLFLVCHVRFPLIPLTFFFSKIRDDILFPFKKLSLIVRFHLLIYVSIYLFFYLSIYFFCLFIYYVVCYWGTRDFHLSIYLSSQFIYLSIYLLGCLLLGYVG